MLMSHVIDQEAAAAERALALRYAPANARGGLSALLSLDATLGGVLRSTREPLVGQMRLAWWREALARLDTSAPPAEPVLRALHAEVLPRGVTGARLSGMVDGWEALLADPLDRSVLEAHAGARGGGLFASGTTLCGADPDARVERAGQGWALADLALHLRQETPVRESRELADAAFVEAFRSPWPTPFRALGALALLARADLVQGARPGGPGRVSRLLWHRLSGR